MNVKRHQNHPPEMTPQREHDVEWWFVQGQVWGEFGTRHLMAVFFRINGLHGNGPPGAMLLQHVIDPRSGRASIDSRITPQTATCHEHILDRIFAGRFPPVLRDVVRRRLGADHAAWIRQNNIVIDDSQPQLGEAAFSVAWNGFALGAEGKDFTLRMGTAPETEAQLILTPESQWLNETSDGLHPSLKPAFEYQCCPRLRARGRFGGRSAQGRFWIDHQRGRYEDWLLGPGRQGYPMLGWDWFGLNLDDGRDLMISRHADAATRRLSCQWGIMFADGVPVDVGAVRTQALRHWTSPRGAARYPVAWQIELPDLGLQGRVDPVSDDQEIPVFGTFAIWEGAATFRGQQGGTEVTGSGRLELVGYGAPLTLPAYIQRRATRFANNLSASLRLPFGD
ncbi:MAG: lipocalin family protein [Paracoccaceae bacterium]|nr:lipocalin family protein [Paracoccaceae bacterium]